MDLEKAISSVEKFFFDLIGNVIPGAIILFGSIWLINPSIPSYYLLSKDMTTIAWLTILVVSYVLGYAVSTISKFLTMIIYGIKSIKKVGFKETVVANIAVKKKFIDLAKETEIDIKDYSGVMELRNYILSRLNTEDNTLTRRFRFISLLNIGVASAMIILSLVYLTLFLHNKSHISLSFIDIMAYIITIILFCDRFVEFDLRTNMFPFTVWEKGLIYRKDKEEKKSE